VQNLSQPSCGQPVIALRPDDKIDGALPAHDLSAFGLGNAAGDANQHVAALRHPRLLKSAQPAELGKNLLRGAFADMAGIEQDDVGTLGRIGDVIAFEREDIAHTFGVVHVHLTAV
jgi:hypothetical protein